MPYYQSEWKSYFVKPSTADFTSCIYPLSELICQIASKQSASLGIGFKKLNATPEFSFFTMFLCILKSKQIYCLEKRIFESLSSSNPFFLTFLKGMRINRE